MNQSKNQIFTLSNLKTKKNLPIIYVVTSGKGGVGKSNISLNIAILLAQLKKNILLLDADIHLGNLNILLGLQPRYNISDAITGKVDIKDAIVPGPGGIDILPASSASFDILDIEDEIIKKIGNSFTKLEHEYDSVIVDTGAGISNNVMSFVLGADKIMVIVTPDPASIADAYGMVKVIKRSNADIPVMMIANMVSSDDEGESLYKKMNLMVRRFLNSNIYFGGSILNDPLIISSIRHQKSIVLEHPISHTVNSLKLVTRTLLKLPTKNSEERTPLFDRIRSYRDITVGENQ